MFRADCAACICFCFIQRKLQYAFCRRREPPAVRENMSSAADKGVRIRKHHAFIRTAFAKALPRRARRTEQTYQNVLRADEAVMQFLRRSLCRIKSCGCIFAVTFPIHFFTVNSYGR